MKISYAIPVCNEFVEIQRLITFLLENKRDEDEIVVLYDSNNGDKEVEVYLRKMNADKSFISDEAFERVSMKDKKYDKVRRENIIVKSKAFAVKAGGF